MKQVIDIYTGTFSDNIDKKIKGTGFAAICKGKHGSATVTAYNEELSYMELWMKEMASILGQFQFDVTQFDGCVIAIHTWTPNLNLMCKKLHSIYNELKSYDEDMWDVVTLKLRRKNRSKYPYHDDAVSIVLSLLRINQTMPLNVLFLVTAPKKQPVMGLAYQKAEVALNDGHSA